MEVVGLWNGSRGMGMEVVRIELEIVGMGNGRVVG